MRYLVLVACILLCRCSWLDTDVQRGYEQNHEWTTGASFTTADVRVITEKTQPVTGHTVICTEPTPDVAKALSTAAKLTLQGGNGATNGTVGASGQSAEAFAELAGRSTALLGLRDGLFQACEAYANGMIGGDAYALILARYGQLMTTLFLGQDITGAAAPAGRANGTSPTLQPPATPSTTGGSPGSTKPNTATAQTTMNLRTASDPRASASNAQPASAPMRVASLTGSVRPSLRLAETTDPQSPDHSPAPQGAPDPVNAVGPGTDTPPPISDVAAQALTRMNEDFIHERILSALIIACIEDYDPAHDLPQPSTTIPSPNLYDSSPPGGNWWLRNKICNNIDLASLLKNFSFKQWEPIVPR